MGACKSKMRVDIGKGRFKPSIADTLGCDINTVIDKSMIMKAEPAESPHITAGKMTREEIQKKGNLTGNGKVSRTKKDTMQIANQCNENIDDCYYYPFGTNTRSCMDHFSSNDGSSFSSKCSSTAHCTFHFDFETEIVARGRKKSGSHVGENSSQSSSGSENTWSVWSTNTMRKFQNGTQKKKVKPVALSDSMVPRNEKDAMIEQTQRQGGYEYWYPSSPSDNTIQRSVQRPSEFWVHNDGFSGGSFEEHDVVKTMRSVQFLDNPRQDFLILQKFLRNAKDDESALAVLLHLNEAGLLKKVVVHDCVENALHEKASRLEQTFRWLLEFHPTILKERPLFCTFLSHCWSIHKVQRKAYWKRFLTLFEVGLSHYPREIGFLFHRDYNKCFSLSPILLGCKSPFEMACLIFGRERVTNAVNDIITKTTKGSTSEFGSTISNMVLAATTNPRITLDAVYFLGRRDPTSLNSLQVELATSKTKAKKENQYVS